jgi:hypothetical protein
MSTRSSIAVKVEDNKVLTIYCHSDGYLDHNGRMLLNHYNNQEKAEAIVNLGDCSFLDKSIEKPEGHDFDNRKDGYSVFYGRDRNEEECEASVFETYEKALAYNSQEYNYYWDGTKWMVDGDVLTEELIKEDN